jgi:hypothetical protein
MTHVKLSKTYIFWDKKFGKITKIAIHMDL